MCSREGLGGRQDLTARGTPASEPFICVASAPAPRPERDGGGDAPHPCCPPGPSGPLRGRGLRQPPRRFRGSGGAPRLPGSGLGRRGRGRARTGGLPPHRHWAGAPGERAGARAPASPCGRCLSRGCPCRRDEIPQGHARLSRVSRAGVSGTVGRERTRLPQILLFLPRIARCVE